MRQAHHGGINLRHESEPTVDQNLRTFLKQTAGVAAATLMMVAMVAFISIPFSLGRHPGDAHVQPIAMDQRPI